MSAPETFCFLPFGNQVLAMTVQEFQTAVERGRVLAGSTATAPPSGANGGEPELLTAKEMQQRTKVKATWFLESARAGTIPHHRIGRYVRFDLAEVRVSTRYRQRAGEKAPP